MVMPFGRPNNSDERGQHYSSESDELGHRMQNLFVIVLTRQLGVAVATHDQLGSDLGETYAIAGSTTEEDEEQGIDAWFFNGRSHKWVPIDVTVTNDRAVLKHKDKREQETGVRVVRLNAAAIEQAARGGEWGLKQISTAMNELISST